MSELTITNEERHSALWQKLTAHMEERINSLLRQNANDHTPEETAKLRGRIAECNRFLGLAEARDQEASG